MKVVAIIQARMRSTRLWGKILEELCGVTVLAHDIRRVRAASRVDEVVVATSDLPVDDPVAEEAHRSGAQVVRGSEQDVLSRYHLAATRHDADVIVRITSDCPLFDPELLDRMLAEFLAALIGDHPWDYYSNTLWGRTYPTGLDAEIFTRQALERAHREGLLPHEREHVTAYLHQHPELFHLGGMSAEEDNSRHRWTLDTPEDLELIRAVYGELYRPGCLFTTDEVLELFTRRPDLALLNSHIRAKAIDADRLGSLVVRADASASMGAGHIMRCLGLAQAWQPESRVTFVLAEGADSHESLLLNQGFDVVRLPAEPGSLEDAAATAALAEEKGAGWLMVDGYHFGPAYTAALAAARPRVLLMDDEGRADLAGVDLLLNQNLHAAAELYPGAPSEMLLLGPRYVLLRSEFLDVGPAPRAIAEQARKVLVTLGGADRGNLTGGIVANLAGTGLKGLQIRVLAGRNNPHAPDLRRLAGGLPVPVEVLDAVSDMPAQYSWADMAVTAGGGTLWELAYLGVPALTVIVAANQEPSSKLLDEHGATRCLGWAGELDAEVLRREFLSLADDQDRRAGMCRVGRNLINGRGASLVLAAMGRLMGRESKA